MTTRFCRTSRIVRGVIACATATTCVAPSVLAAQKAAFDRNLQPKPSASAAVRIPNWTRTKLANGAELVVTQKRDLPLVSVTINFIGGTFNFEPADKLGVANFTAQMLSEGTTTRTGEQLADAQQLLGTRIAVGVGGESGSIAFTALNDRVAPALALVADMLVNPTFPAPALERLRGRALISLQQQKDQPTAIADKVYSKVLYGESHPYGRSESEQTVRAVTRDDVVAFHKTYFKPGRAVITVTGDVDPAEAKRIVETALAPWAAGGEKPTFAYPAPPPLKERTIYLIDKPKAAQSVFSLGLPGPSRDTPDYYAIQVMNQILGVLFQSRLNHNIREEKGYSYGVSSGFDFGRGPGAFTAGGDIITAKTDSALIEFMKELKGVRGDLPFTDDEITQGKESLIQGLVRRFASVSAIGGAVGGMYVQGLPESYYRDYTAKINAITRDDMIRVAKKYIDLDHLNIVIVGDRAIIEEALRKTGIAQVKILDIEGKPVTVP